MGVFRTHREAARANNRVIAVFFLAMTILTFAFLAAVGGHYVLGWW